MKHKDTYQAWTCHDFNHHANLKITEELLKPPREDEILVKVAAFAPGFPDMLMVNGKYQLRPEVPFTPCMEFAGTIERLGAHATRYSIGQRVMGTVRYGSAAQFVTAKESDCFLIPERFNFFEAASFLIAYKTAYVALISRGAVSEGETVLIHGASGGVGLAALQLARHLGAKTIAIVSSEEKADLLSEYANTDILVCPEGGFKSDVNTITCGVGADVIFDPIGGNVFDESTKCIAPFGRLLIVGFAGGRIANAATNHMLIKQYSVVGVRAGEFGRIDQVRGEEVMNGLLKMVERGAFKPHIHDVWNFKDLIHAFDAIVAREVVGRIVIDALS